MPPTQKVSIHWLLLILHTPKVISHRQLRVILTQKVIKQYLLVILLMPKEQSRLHLASPLIQKEFIQNLEGTILMPKVGVQKHMAQVLWLLVYIQLLLVLGLATILQRQLKLLLANTIFKIIMILCLLLETA